MGPNGSGKSTSSIAGHLDYEVTDGEVLSRRRRPAGDERGRARPPASSGHAGRGPRRHRTTSCARPRPPSTARRQARSIQAMKNLRMHRAFSQRATLTLASPAVRRSASRSSRWSCLSSRFRRPDARPLRPDVDACASSRASTAPTTRPTLASSSPLHRAVLYQSPTTTFSVDGAAEAGGPDLADRLRGRGLRPLPGLTVHCAGRRRCAAQQQRRRRPRHDVWGLCPRDSALPSAHSCPEPPRTDRKVCQWLQSTAPLTGQFRIGVPTRRRSSAPTSLPGAGRLARCEVSRTGRPRARSPPASSPRRPTLPHVQRRGALTYQLADDATATFGGRPRRAVAAFVGARGSELSHSRTLPRPSTPWLWAIGHAGAGRRPAVEGSLRPMTRLAPHHREATSGRHRAGAPRQPVPWQERALSTGATLRWLDRPRICASIPWTSSRELKSWP